MPVFEMPLSACASTGAAARCPAILRPIGAALGELEATGLDCTLEPAGFRAPGVKCFDLWFTGVCGARIHCKFLRPEKPADAFWRGWDSTATCTTRASGLSGCPMPMRAWRCW